jgi:hypothetical protein
LLEDAFLVSSLGASVDDTLLRFVCPERDEPPVVAVNLVGSLVRDDLQAVSGRNILSWWVAAVRDDLCIEASLEVSLFDEERVASTHTGVFVGRCLQRGRRGASSPTTRLLTLQPLFVSS